ncbi:hypothetical protein ACIBCH_20595 [Amycolatopsis thailandensis]|uniref:hypothetical protein n=1 Tax=Amycolatopsis thailandensis TaxID=589330 RepID=UPI0037B17DCC
MASFTDDFNRADSSDLGANWVEVSGDWAIVSNQLSAGNTGGTVILRAAGAMASNDNYAQTTIAATTAASHGIWCRGNSNITSGYLWRNDGSSWNLFSVVGGSFSVIGTYAAAAAPGDVAKVQAVGSTIKAFVNGVERVSVTDTGVTTGTSVGYRTESTNAIRFDDFSAADVTSGTSAPAGNATGTGAANTAAAKISPPAAAAAGTGSAGQVRAAVSPAAGAASGNGAAAVPTLSIATPAGHSSGAGAASAPAAAVSTAAGTAAGTGAASAVTTPPAGASAGHATGTGTAHAVAGAATIAAGTAAGTGSALVSVASVGARTSNTSGTGLARDVAAALSSGTGAGGEGTAHDPTVLTSGTEANVPAPRAAGSGHAHDATVHTASAATGSWWGLFDIYREAAEIRRDELERDPEACPRDGEPLVTGPDGELFCRFDGWRPNQPALLNN